MKTIIKETLGFLLVISFAYLLIQLMYIFN